MQYRLSRIFLGILLGLCIPLIICVIFVENIALFILIPIFPIIGVLVGMILGWRCKLPALKVWQSLLFFTVFISVTLAYDNIRSHVLEAHRKRMTHSIVMQYPDMMITENKYSRGNGMEIPPNVAMTLESDDEYETMRQYFDEYFKRNGWNNQGSRQWWKNNYRAYLNEYYEDHKPKKNTYSFRIDFYGNWMTHFKGYEE